MISAARLVYGVGLNDSDCATETIVNGKRVVCPIYRKWVNMLNRCYSKRYQSEKPSYAECVVCDEWLTFSNFKKWMDKQDWHGKHLDKDILFEGNKIYSPETCVFVDAMTNGFVIASVKRRGDYPLGVSYCAKRDRYLAYCNNPFHSTSKKVGRFKTPELAHAAWKKRKHEIACQLADLQTDERVAKALRERYL